MPAGSRGPAGRPTAKDGGETGKSVSGPRPGTPVDAEVDLDVIWRLGSLPAVRQRIPWRLDAEAGRRRRDDGVVADRGARGGLPAGAPAKLVVCVKALLMIAGEALFSGREVVG